MTRTVTGTTVPVRCERSARLVIDVQEGKTAIVRST